MKKALTIILSIALFPVFAEETYVKSTREKTLEDYNLPYGEWDLWMLVKYADIAGVGRFTNQPSETNSMALVFVDDCWTGGVQDEIVSIGLNYTDWVVPTNVPVVFFAMRSESYVTNFTFHSMSPAHKPETLTNFFERALANSIITFPGGDRAWFRTTRDNGHMYDFTTNLWKTLRVDEYNQTNYYEVLRSASNIPIEESKRVYMDSRDAISDLFYKMPTEFLIESMQDQLLHEYIRDSLLGRVWQRGWTHTNGVWYAPPPE